MEQVDFEIMIIYLYSRNYSFKTIVIKAMY